MRRACPAFFVLLLIAVAFPARSEVTLEAPLVEDTAHTLNQGEWKLGIQTSSYGITDRLQLDSALLLDLALLNAGLKYKLVDAPQLTLSVNAFGGGSVLLLAVQSALFYGGARLDASMPLGPKLSLNLTGGWNLWQASTLGQAEEVLPSLRLHWFSLRAGLQYVHAPRHIFFLNAGTPTSWMAAMGPGSHDFDATDFWQALLGYQYSRGVWNIRFDVGWGASLFGRGPVAGLDFYVRL
jgi:hypothetical protein